MQKTKKLLFVISSLEGSGGSERALSNRVNYLVENYGYDITIITTSVKRQGVNFYYLDPRIKQFNIPIDFGKHGILQKIKFVFKPDYKEEAKLMEFILKENFDICTSFGSETFLYKINGNRKFSTVKENRFTYKKILTDEKLKFHKKIWRAIRFHRAVKIQRKMDYIITLTEEDAAFWEKYLKTVTVIPNFIDLINISVSNLDHKSIIAVGRLEKEKDFNSMIVAFKKVFDCYPDWKLEIFGSGSLKEELLALIKSLELTNNIFINEPIKDIFAKYKESSFYIHTAFYEGFPNTMLEAMSHGLAVVAFESVGGVKVLVKDGKNGFLIENRNIENLSDKILEVISNKNLQKTMARCARDTAEKYNIDRVMNKWHEFYSNL